MSLTGGNNVIGETSLNEGTTIFQKNQPQVDDSMNLTLQWTSFGTEKMNKNKPAYLLDCQNTAHPSTYLLSSSVIVFALDFGLNIPS